MKAPRRLIERMLKKRCVRAGDTPEALGVFG
jgi:hypothetical protein